MHEACHQSLLSCEFCSLQPGAVGSHPRFWTAVEKDFATITPVKWRTSVKRVSNFWGSLTSLAHRMELGLKLICPPASVSIMNNKAMMLLILCTLANSPNINWCYAALNVGSKSLRRLQKINSALSCNDRHSSETQLDKSFRSLMVAIKNCVCIGSAVQCPIPENPGHGKAVFSSVSFNSFVSYECKYGYMLVGEGTRRCGPNKKWTGLEPACKGNSVLNGPSSSLSPLSP